MQNYHKISYNRYGVLQGGDKYMKKLKTVIYVTTFSILASPLVATVVRMMVDPGVGGG